MILEQAGHLNEVGAGIQMAPNNMRILGVYSPGHLHTWFNKSNRY